MDYNRIYNSIIENRRNNPLSKKKINDPSYVYTENHHIIPSSLGGSDDKTNMVRVTAKEHFVLHHLLVYNHKDNIGARTKMVKAFLWMVCCKSDNQERYITAREDRSMDLF